jgi:4-amino-4-deoxy-L-arabinose transferase-like glycosyltransferase
MANTAWRPLLGLALAAIVLHVAVVGRYGYFRDELYYLASTRHLDFGYVDHPPLSIALLALVRAVLGDSLLALRIVPVLAGAAMVVVTGCIASMLGARAFGQCLAALCVIVSPMYLGSHHVYSMNALDQLAWTLATFVLIRILEGGGSWAFLGVILGLGLENKISVLWLGSGIATGLVLTPHRRLLATRGPWIAAAIAALLFAPHVAWQAAHGWPTLEFMRNAAQLKNAPTTLGEFVRTQLLVMNPITAPVWIAGVVACLFSSALARWRILAIAFLAVAVSFAASGSSKAHYLAPAYPPMLAAGAMAIESLIASRAWRRALEAAVLALVIAIGALMAPFALPVLPVESFVRYMHAAGITPRAEERSNLGELPQHYADMFGWDELAEKVAHAYGALPSGDQARCAIFAQNYGEAGALDVLGPRFGLPEGRTLCGHNSYWLWGPHGMDGDVMIVVGGDLADNRAFFASVERVDVVHCERCMPYERDLPVYVCRGIKAPLAEVWPRLKHFI